LIDALNISAVPDWLDSIQKQAYQMYV